jgi:O-antigen/teichoic acid export membrane protein
LILIFGLQIAFTTVGVEWIYSLYEEYAYITARTIAFKLISMALLFAFVRDENDVNAYAAITVFSTVGSNVLNFVHSRTYWTYRIKKWRDVCKHLKSILIMFASSVAVSIYVYSDTTMLGFMKTDYEVGLYAVSSRVYTILKSIISSLLIVTIPRLSFYYANGDRKQFDDTVQKIMDSITVLLLPSVVGVFMLSRNIVLIVGGDAYAEAAISLRILSIALLFSLYGWIYNECVLLPTRNEKIISYATWASALANIGLNIALIPKWGQNAAAFTTVVAELIVMAICYRYGKGYGTFKILNRTFFTSIIGCAEIMLVCVVVPFLIPNMMISTCVCITISAVVYAVTLLMLKNQVALKLFYRLMKIVQTIGIKKNKIEENA